MYSDEELRGAVRKILASDGVEDFLGQLLTRANYETLKRAKIQVDTALELYRARRFERALDMTDFSKFVASLATGDGDYDCAIVGVDGPSLRIKASPEARYWFRSVTVFDDENYCLGTFNLHCSRRDIIKFPLKMEHISV